MIRYLSIDAKPGWWGLFLLPHVLIVAVVALYLGIAHVRHIKNPDNPQICLNKLTPTELEMARGFWRTVVKGEINVADELAKVDAHAKELASMHTPLSQWALFKLQTKARMSPVTEGWLFIDTVATGKRFLASLGIVVFLSVFIGLHMGMLPYAEALLLKPHLFFSKVPPLALLPMLFVVFGTDELSKVILCVIGVTLVLTLDTYNSTKAVQSELKVKALTLGACDFEVVYRIVFRQILPRAIETIRISLVGLTLYIIAAEMIVADAGLAYRMSVVRRLMAMDVIIPYVMYFSTLLFLADLGLRKLNSYLHPWYNKE